MSNDPNFAGARDVRPASVIAAAIDQALLRTHTMQPGTIVSYNAAANTCSVQPMLTARTGTDEALLGVMDDVPIWWPRLGGGRSTFPIDPGNLVTIVFAERGLEPLATGQHTIPADARHHSLTDAVVLPFSPFIETTPIPNVSTTDAEWGLDSALVHSGPGGVVLGDPLSALALAQAAPTTANLDALKPILAQVALDLAALYVLLAIPSPAAAAITAFLPSWPVALAAQRTKGQ